MALSRVHSQTANWGTGLTSQSITPTTYPTVGDFIWALLLLKSNGGAGSAHTSSNGFSQIGSTTVSADGSTAISLWTKPAITADTSGSYGWTWTGSSNGYILIYIGRGQAATSYVSASAGPQVNTAGTSVPYPNITIPDANSLLLGFQITGDIVDTTNMTGPNDPTGTAMTEEQDANKGAGTGTWAEVALYTAFLTGGAGATDNGASGTVDVSAVSMSGWVVIKPPPPIETMRPTGVSGLTNLTGAATDIDQDPDGTITDAGLIGSDPSGSSGSVGPVYPNATVAATGQTGFAWATGGTANVTDTSDTTSSTEASATSTLAGYFSFASGAFSGVPAGATITGVSVDIKHNAGTTNRVTPFLQLGTANGTLIGSEVDAVDNTVAGTTKLGTAAVVHTVTAFGAVPTLAQLQTSGAAGFGVRLRITRSSASTYVLFSIKVTVTYTTPGLTTNTQVDIAMGDPTTGALITGTATGEIRAWVRKRGTGADSQARLEVRNAAGTLLGTPVADTTVSSTTGMILSGFFDQSIILSETDVVVRFVGTGASGGLSEPVAVEWNGQTTPSAPAQTLTGGGVLFIDVGGGALVLGAVSVVGGGAVTGDIGAGALALSGPTLTGGGAREQSALGSGTLVLGATPLTGGAAREQSDLGGGSVAPGPISVTGGGAITGDIGAGALALGAVALAGGGVALVDVRGGAVQAGPVIITGGGALVGDVGGGGLTFTFNVSGGGIVAGDVGGGALALGAALLTGGGASLADVRGGALALGPVALAGGGARDASDIGGGTLALGGLVLAGGGVALVDVQGGALALGPVTLVGGGARDQSNAGAGSLALGPVTLVGGGITLLDVQGGALQLGAVTLAGGGARDQSALGGGSVQLIGVSLTGGGVALVDVQGGALALGGVALAGGGARDQSLLGGGSVVPAAILLTGGGVELDTVGAGSLALSGVLLTGGGVIHANVGGGALGGILVLSGGGIDRSAVGGGTLQIGAVLIVGGGAVAGGVGGGNLFSGQQEILGGGAYAWGVGSGILDQGYTPIAILVVAPNATASLSVAAKALTSLGVAVKPISTLMKGL